LKEEKKDPLVVHGVGASNEPFPAGGAMRENLEGVKKVVSVLGNHRVW